MNANGPAFGICDFIRRPLWEICNLPECVRLWPPFMADRGNSEIRSQKKRALFTKFRIRVANRMHQHPFLQPLWDARSCPPFLVGDLDVHCLVERLEVSFIETDREKRNFGNDILLRFLHCLSEKKIDNVVVLGFSGFKMKLENMDFCRI